MNEKEYKTKELIKRFIPYYRNHKKIIILDLFCAALTTVCELVLPMIIRFLTNTGMQDITQLTVSVIGLSLIHI